MKIQVTLYDRERKVELTRHVIEVPRKKWETMDFLEQEDCCKQAVQNTFHWHWRELSKNEA